MIIRTAATSLILLGALLAAPAMAETKTFDCSASPDDDAMLACRELHAKKADADLAAAQKKLVANADDDAQKTALAKADKAWRAYRAAQCDADTYESVGGAAHDPAVLECKEALTLDRLTLLQHRLDNP